MPAVCLRPEAALGDPIGQSAHKADREATAMHFRCPGCQARLKAKPEQTGRRVRCPKCRTAVTVPAEGETGSGASEALWAAETGAAGAASTPGLAAALAWAQVCWANAVGKIGRRDEAVRVAREAIQTLELEVERTGRADLKNVLNWACQNLADLL